MKTKIQNMLLIASAIIFLASCVQNNKDTSSNAPKTIHSEDGLYSTVIPKGWKEIKDFELNDDAQIQASNKLKDRHAIVIIEDSEDFECSFDEWKEAVLDNYSSGWDKTEVESDTEVTVNQIPARQMVLKGVAEGIRIKGILTCIKGEKQYVQVFCWTSSSKYQASLEDFNTILNSLKGIE